MSTLGERMADSEPQPAKTSTEADRIREANEQILADAPEE